MLPLVALTCPQCAAALPRAARWRTVTCSYCGAVVTLSGSATVERAGYRASLAQARQAGLASGANLQWRTSLYRVLMPLGRGEHSDVLLAERVGAQAERVTIKLSRSAADAGALECEAAALDALQTLDVPGAAYFTQRLPQPIGLGLAELDGGPLRTALALRHPPGFWGSLADVIAQQRAGIDPRHAVWIWRRMLEVLSFVHDAGWTHGDIAPEHALVHPRDHGVLLIGWCRARQATGADHATAAASDLARSAWTVRALLHGNAAGEPEYGSHTPAPFAALLRRCCDGGDALVRQGAGEIHKKLTAAARESFGAPQFFHFDPTAPAV